MDKKIVFLLLLGTLLLNTISFSQAQTTFYEGTTDDENNYNIISEQNQNLDSVDLSNSYKEIDTTNKKIETEINDKSSEKFGVKIMNFLDKVWLFFKGIGKSFKDVFLRG